MTAKQTALFRKIWDREPLTETEKLAVFDLPFAERSAISMRNFAERKQREAEASQ